LNCRCGEDDAGDDFASPPGQYCTDFRWQWTEPNPQSSPGGNICRTPPGSDGKQDKAMIGPFDGKSPKTFGEFTDKRFKTLLDTLRHGVVAGVAGGLAEVAWVTLYAGATGIDPATLARGVTTAAGLNALAPAMPVALGVTVHMALAATLGIALAFVWRALSSHRLKIASPFPFMLAALVGVWAINFFVVLPVVSPAFVYLVPYPVSLVSKILFGLAAAEALRRQDASALQAQPALRAEPVMIRRA
jgi:hypothetical protein